MRTGGNREDRSGRRSGPVRGGGMTATAAVNVEELVRMHSADECPLDQWNRYRIVPDGAKQPVAHTRATTVAGALDDGFAVNAWTRRLTVVGFAQNPVLFTRLCATDPEDRNSIDQLCDEAKSKAGGDDARNLGTALHAFTEKADRGQEIYIPPPYDDDVTAYRKFLAEVGIEIIPEYIERYVVVPGLDGIGVAGKTDRIVRFGSRLMIADVKTGTLGNYSWLKIAIQLAIYSRARSFYDAATKKHLPFPDVAQDVGLVFHLPAGAARPALWFVDLDFGWEAAQVACQVRAWRKRNDIADELRPDTASTSPEVRRARLVERIMTLREIPGGVDAIVGFWPTKVATFKHAATHTDGDLDLIALALNAAEAAVRAPFGAPDPAGTAT